MNRNSREILRVVEGNDTSSTQLFIDDRYDWHFRSRDRDDFTRLGVAIGNNTHIKHLNVFPSGIPSDVLDEEFYDGLKQNSSIRELTLHEVNIAGGVGQEILKVYQENNNLTHFWIENAILQNGGEYIIATTFRCCANISYITMQNCNIICENFLSMDVKC